jgi:hypothetical protein
MRASQFDLAMKTMQSARELFPKRYEFTGSISKIYRAMGKSAEAEKELNMLTSSDQPPEARRIGLDELVSFLSARGRVREALRAADEK